MLTLIWRPQNAAPGEQMPPLAPRCYATARAEIRWVSDHSLIFP